jgi:hypothetical protein
MSVRQSQLVVFPSQSLASLSTVHDSVIGLSSAFPRFPTMGVPSVTESSCVGAYQPRLAESPFESPRCVASRLRCVQERFVASASVSKRVASASVSKRTVVFLEACVPPSVVASASQSSPRVALNPALQSLRRAASAKKCSRIAGRLARLVASRPRQTLQ